MRLPVLLAFAAGTLAAAFSLPHILPLATIDVSGYDPADACIFLWNFWWTGRALGSGHGLYWTDLLGYPHGASLALHSYPLPYSLLSLPVQWLVPGLPGLILAFNLVVLLSFVLTSYAAGFVSGVMVAIAPFRSLNVTRLHLMATEFPAIYVLCWIVFMERPSRPRAIALGVSLALCVYSSPEYAIAAALFSAVWLMYEWRSWYTPTLKGLRVGLGIACISCVILVSPLLIAQASAIVRHEIRPVRSLDEVIMWSPALASFFVPSRMHPLYGSLLSAAGEYGSPGLEGMRSETTIPLTIWVLVLVALTRVKRDRSMFWVIAGAVLLVLTLGPFLRLTGSWTTRVPLPYAALYEVLPLLRASRDPTRLLPMATLMLAVVAAFGVRACLAGIRNRSLAAIVTALLVAAVVFESLTRSSTHATAGQLVPAIYERIANTPGEFAVLDLGPEPLPLLAQTVHGKPITTGSISVPRAAVWGVPGAERDLRDPRDFMSLESEARGARRREDRDELIRLNFRFVVFSEISSYQYSLAREMGLRPVDGSDWFLWEVPSADSSR
ncbi:MAG: hypothetical protein DME70_01170 [Verrucomicrobia bacterium]|nr:MAG: hypothetical protein DME70_01170 [Verrucomicrobiota bacterium]